ncbi:hypothetical protein GW17_00023346, partial [Ensete ventricosum]
HWWRFPNPNPNPITSGLFLITSPVLPFLPNSVLFPLRFPFQQGEILASGLRQS